MDTTDPKIEAPQLVATGDLFGELEYIAASPLPEHGGFNPRVVAAATWAAHEIESMRAEMNDVCITLTDCIEECEGFDDPRTANKLHEVRKVLLSYLPNV